MNNVDQRNSFGKVYPEFVQFWDYDKNADTPYDVTSGSGSKRWFKCRTCGRSHFIQVYTFPFLEGCNDCIRQIHTSFGEYAVAYYLRKCGYEVIQGDREILGGLELDIYIPSIKTAIEYDGSFFHKQEVQQRKAHLKYDKCKELGITLLRVCECQNEREASEMDVSDVCDWFTTFRSLPNKKPHEAMIKVLLNHFGITCDVDINRDSNEIDLPRRTYRIKNSVACHEKLSKMWLYDKNDVNPESVSANGASHKYWFECPRCGRNWYTDPHTAAHIGGCWFCHPKSGHSRIVEKTEDGKTVIRIWDAACQAEKAFGTANGTILRAARGTCKREKPHVVYGRWWEFLEEDAK